MAAARPPLWILAAAALAVGAALLLLRARDDAQDLEAPAERPDAQEGGSAPMLAGVPQDPSRRAHGAAPSGSAPHARAPGARPGEATPGTAGSSRSVEGRVLRQDGGPVAGARVTVLERSMEVPGLAARTDADGRFTLRGPIAASALLRIEAPGFGTATARLVDDGLPIDLRLAPGRTVGGVIVDAETGQGIAGVALGARPQSAPVGSPWALPTQSAADGSFVVELPATGPHVLEVGSRSLPAEPTPAHEYVPTSVPGVTEGASDLRVALRRGLPIEVALLGEDGQPCLHPVMGDLVGRTGAGDPDYTRRRLVLAVGGRLKIHGLEPGRYDLQITPTLHGLDENPPIPARLLDIAAGSTDLSVRLARGERLRGRIVDEHGDPVTSQGRLYAYREGRRGGHAEGTGVAGGDGTFVLGPFERGVRYDVLGTGFAGRRAGWVSGVQPGDERVELVVPSGGAILGRVLDAAGEPAPPDVPVGAVATDLKPETTGSRAFARTGAGGVFLLDGLAQATFEVQAGGGNSAYLGESVVGVHPGATDLVLRVALGLELSGTLVDPRGEPVAATSLQADDGAHRAAMRPYVQVGPDGRFTLRGLKAGPVRLGMMRAGAWVSLGEVEAPATDARVVVPDP